MRWDNVFQPRRILKKGCHCIESKAKFYPVFSCYLLASEGLCPRPLPALASAYFVKKIIVNCWSLELRTNWQIRVLAVQTGRVAEKNLLSHQIWAKKCNNYFFRIGNHAALSVYGK